MKKEKEIITKKETYFCDFCGEEIDVNRTCSYCDKHICIKCGKTCNIGNSYFIRNFCNEHFKKYKLYEDELKILNNEFETRKNELYKQIMEGEKII